MKMYYSAKFLTDWPDDHLVFPIGLTNKNWVDDVETLLLVNFCWTPLTSFRGEVENVSANQRPWLPSCFSDLTDKHKRGKGVGVLLLVKFRWIHLSSYRGEVENISANQTPGRSSCYSDRPEKHKLDRGHWDLASWKCLSQSETRAITLFFRLARKNTNVVGDI